MDRPNGALPMFGKTGEQPLRAWLCKLEKLTKIILSFVISLGQNVEPKDPNVLLTMVAPIFTAQMLFVGFSVARA